MFFIKRILVGFAYEAAAAGCIYLAYLGLNYFGPVVMIAITLVLGAYWVGTINHRVAEDGESDGDD